MEVIFKQYLQFFSRKLAEDQNRADIHGQETNISYKSVLSGNFQVSKQQSHKWKLIMFHHCVNDEGQTKIPHKSWFSNFSSLSNSYISLIFSPGFSLLNLAIPFKSLSFTLSSLFRRKKKKKSHLCKSAILLPDFRSILSRCWVNLCDLNRPHIEST